MFISANSLKWIARLVGVAFVVLTKLALFDQATCLWALAGWIVALGLTEILMLIGLGFLTILPRRKS